MGYPHQPGSPWFDGADAFEAYLDMQERERNIAEAVRTCIACQPMEDGCCRLCGSGRVLEGQGNESV